MAAVTPSNTETEPGLLLEIIGLSKHFGGLKAVDDVDFTLPRGEIRAIIGPNGAGKTTFVSLISGRLQPSAGRVLFDGRDMTGVPAFRRVRAGIAYTFQITSIFSNLSVHDNVALAVQRHLIDHGDTNNGNSHRLTDEAIRHGVIDALTRTGIKERADMRAGNLAYGHQRLVEIAMGLALKPRLLILDEPTQGLSDGEIDNFIELVRSIASQTTILLIEHNMPVVMALADRISVLNFGRLLAEGTPEEIRTDIRVQDAYLGTSHDDV